MPADSLAPISSRAFWKARRSSDVVPIGKELAQHLIHALLSPGHFQIRIILNMSVNTYRVADRFGLHNELKPVGKDGHHRAHRGSGNGKALQGLFRPVGQLGGLGLFGGEGLTPRGPGKRRVCRKARE